MSVISLPGSLRSNKAETLQQVWRVDPRARTVAVYTSAAGHVLLTEADILTAGEVLPGWSVPVRDVFAELDRRMTAG